ncbi:lamin tail domain-containing protein [Haloferula sp.]|uniref:lamin tail domain-containing protein n=1 Tax=Haloferula sp. TaxID=2497595 RepID=UPI00329FD60F
MHIKTNSLLQGFACSVATFILLGNAVAVPIDLSGGTAAQSTTLSSFDAGRAIDGINNFTHTISDDPDPTWQVALPEDHTFQEITLVNRGGTGSWLPRFRDLTVQIVDFNGDVDTDFNGGTIVYSSPLQNPGNILDSPASITVTIPEATGNMIRVIRTPDGADGNDGVLSLNEVTAVGLERIISFSTSTPLITPGDPINLDWEVSPTVTGLTIDNGIGNVLPNTSAGVGSILEPTGPNATTTYEITASSSGGSDTASTTIAVTDEPLIYSFEADNVFITSGSTVNLSWNVGGNATSLTLDGSDVAGTSGTAITVNSNTDYELVAANGNGTVTRTVSVRVFEEGVPVINEFLASNSDGLTDIDGSSSDWIELYNPGTIPAPLLNFSLTDDETDLTMWSFPDVTMAPGSYLVIFASGESKVNPASELHTNFTLNADGEYLALIKPDGTSIASEFVPSFPAQRNDVSYGLDQGSNIDGYFLTPTPGAANGSSVLGFVKDTTFSIDRGFYTTPIAVGITSETPGAEIRYTLDGTKPTSTTGQVYSAGSPINISQTTVLRAAAYLDQYEPTNVDTHTYIFKADVITAPNMDTGITQDPTYAPQMDAALSAIPSVSLNFAGDLNYEEQEVSIEFINFETGSTQVDAGMERFGGYHTNFPKRSARIVFRSEYGPGKLNFDPFENHDWPSYQPAKKYDAVELRAGNHDMWQRGAYLSNRFADDAMLDMGHIAPHGRFVHVYMNGEYNGQYHLRERWNASMLTEYFDGPKDDYEAINANNSGQHNFQTGTVYDGTGQQWTETQTLINGPTPFTLARTHLDIINAIDFMLLWSSGNCEAEFRAAGSATLGVPFKFFFKDADGFLRNPNHGVTRPGPLDSLSLLATEADPDYQMLLADRIHKHFFNDGALTPAKNIARLQDRVTETEVSFIAECARWVGPDWQTLDPPFLSMHPDINPARWVSFQDDLINNKFPALTASMISDFKTANMYPATDAPVFSEHGGIVLPGSGPTVSVTNSDYKVYYIFGSGDTDPDEYRHSLDPRLPGGAINLAATMISFDGSGGVPTNFVNSGDTWSYLDDGSDQGTAWRTTSFVENGAWESGPSQLGYGEDGEVTLVDYIDTDPVASGIQKNITTYFRKSDINIPDTSLYDDFTINFWYDDGIALYVNGVEVERLHITADAPYTETSSFTVGNNEFGTIQVPISYFNNGNNTIAAEVHQAANDSSDISFNLTLVGNLTGGGDPGLTSDPIPVTTSGWLLSRAYNTTTDEWSALNSAFFTPEPELADNSNLVISEFNYHPNNPLTPEELAISSDPDEFEFVELKNVSTLPLDLSGLSFTDGIEFEFAINNILPAGGRMVIVRNKEAFEERYASELGSIIYGTNSLGESEYSGKLGNGGEQLVLEDAGGSVIHDFTYDDQAPWPTASDGPGFSLALINPALPIPDHDIATNWAASGRIHGYPGSSSPVGFVGNPDADDDQDGLNAMVEYALGSSDSNPGDSTVSTSVESYEVDGETDDYLTVSFLRNDHVMNAVTVEAQIGEDLTSWNGEPELVLVSETDNLDGTTSVVYRSAVPIGGRPSGKEFIRVGVEQ